MMKLFNECQYIPNIVSNVMLKTNEKKKGKKLQIIRNKFENNR